MPVHRSWVHFVGTFAVTLVTVAGLRLRPVVVSGSSMEPTLSRGDVCIVRGVEEAAVGDIVLVDRGADGYVLHRVVRIVNRRAYITRGDANENDDRDPVARSALRGTVVARFPLGRVLDGWIRQVGGGTLHNQSQSDGDDGEASTRASAHQGRAP